MNTRLLTLLFAALPAFVPAAPACSDPAPNAAEATPAESLAPLLKVSLRAEALREGGRRALLYRTADLKELRARVLRVPAEGAEAARLFQRYLSEYRDERDAEQSRYAHAPYAPAKLLATEGMAGEWRECALRLPERGQQGAFEPASLFPDAGERSLYFVEFTGTPLGEGGKRIVTQSLVQLTDLALLQLADERGFVGYAYRLSDSSPLPSAELAFMDAEGKVLSTLAVEQGLAQGAIPEGACLARLRCGGDCVTAALRPDKAPVRQYHPLEPRDEATGFLVTDRRSYTPGDTVRLLGIIRDYREKEWHFPEGVQAQLRYRYDGIMNGTINLPLDVAADGSFLTEFTLPEGLHGVKSLTAILFFANRSCPGQAITIPIQPKATPALLISGNWAIEGNGLVSEATVRTVEGEPLAGQQLRWTLSCCNARFTPEGYDDYCFGDERIGDPLPGNFARAGRSSAQEASRTLDAEGHASVQLTLPAHALPTRRELYLGVDCGYTKMPNGLTYNERLWLDPAALYAGLRRASAISRAGDELALDLLLLDREGKPYADEPVNCELTVTHQALLANRYGKGLKFTQKEGAPQSISVALPAGGTTVRLPLPEAGCYDIVLRGKDAEGRAFASAIRQFCCGADGAAPWMQGLGGELALIPDKRSYAAGETARLLLLSGRGDIEGEAVIVVEGKDGRRVLRRRVDAAHRVVDIPLLPEDGFTPNLTVALVQGAGPRSRSGLPLVQLGKVGLTVEDRGRELDIELAPLPKTLPAGATCNVSGRVLDAEGKPVADAPLLVYAKDVSTAASGLGLARALRSAQERGAGTLAFSFPEVRDLPRTPGLRALFSNRGASRHPSRFQRPALMGDELANGDFANKGVFVGDSGQAGAPAPAEPSQPAALWQRLRTDAEGRFRTTFTTPAARADYQVVVLACGQRPDQFGETSTLIGTE